MIIYSELTKNKYGSVEECKKAEEDYHIRQVELTKKNEEKARARKVRADEVNEAFKNLKEAEKTYTKLLNGFIKDYGSFHMTYRDGDVKEEDVSTTFPFLSKFLNGDLFF